MNVLNRGIETNGLSSSWLHRLVPIFKHFQHQSKASIQFHSQGGGDVGVQAVGKDLITAVLGCDFKMRNKISTSRADVKPNKALDSTVHSVDQTH